MRQLRERGELVGLSLETLDGPALLRSRASRSEADRGSAATGVAHDGLERLAIPALRAHADVVVLHDRLTSAAFRDAVIARLERPIALIATAHARPDPFTDQLKRRPPLRSYS
jgi:nucleoside-triphosphatase